MKLIPKEELEKLPEVPVAVPEPLASKELEIEDDSTTEEGA